MMGIPGMFKPIIRQLLSDVQVKFDAKRQKVSVRKGAEQVEYTFDEIEAMINEGKLLIEG